jgi:hypothetical protein
MTTDNSSSNQGARVVARVDLNALAQQHSDALAQQTRNAQQQRAAIKRWQQTRAERVAAFVPMTKRGSARKVTL